MGKNRKLAFTLIELMVVVAIIGILAVIAIPNFLHAQMKAKIAHTQANFYTFSNAFQAFQMDNSFERQQYAGNEFIQSDFGKLYQNSGVTGSCKRFWLLTTPVPYLSSFDSLQDRFDSRELLAEVNGELFVRNAYKACYDFAACAESDCINTGPWLINSKGPDGRVNIIPQMIFFNNSFDLELMFLNQKTYSISNGLYSRGDIFRSSKNTGGNY